MLQSLKRLSWLLLLAGAAQPSFAFSLLGPVNEAYQVNVIGYNLPGDIGAPKNVGQEYRRNTPTMYYSCDANFVDFFGTRGLQEVDKAFAAFNAIPPASQMSPDLSEFPFAARRRNWKAEALYLFDLKSVIMSLVIEQLGLAEPTRYVWTLHNRFLLPNTTCPQGEIYDVIKRNFDPLIGTSLDQLKPTSYINGTLYSYQLVEFCNAPLPPQAVTLPMPVDALAEIYTPIADGYGFNGLYTFSPWGGYFTGLTYDDVGGLRYLLSTNNINFEPAAPNTQVLVTNYVPQLLTTSNLTLLAEQALTNAPGALNAIFPNVVILSSSNYFVTVNLTNVNAYFTNFPWDPIRTPAHLVFVTNVTPTAQTRYVHTFGNLLAMIATPSGWKTMPLLNLPTDNNGELQVTIETTSAAVSNAPWAPVGQTNILTNTFRTTYLTNAIVGEYITVPTNACDIGIINPILTNFYTVTNVLVAATNFQAITPGGATNAGTILFYSQQMITWLTNYTFVIYPVICDTTNVALTEGVDKINFIRRDYDSLLTRFFKPLTNEYKVTQITNGVPASRTVRRIITGPDILLTARDIAPGPDQDPTRSVYTGARNITYDSSQVAVNYAGQAGPGIITGWSGTGPGTTFVFDSVGPIYRNFGPVSTNAYRTELNQIGIFLWGSFDGTTNAPVVYPNDASLTDMEMQALTQVTPPYLGSGTVGVDYLGQLQVQSGSAAWQPPVFWTLAPGSPGLPPGLQIMTGGDGSGLIFGIPQQAGTFDFVVRVVDSQAHTVDRSYAIRIDPAQ